MVQSGNIADVKFDAKDSNKAIAGGTNTGAAYYSIDGGRHWQNADHVSDWGQARVELTYARKDSSIVYASVDRNFGRDMALQERRPEL